MRRLKASRIEVVGVSTKCPKWKSQVKSGEWKQGNEMNERGVGLWDLGLGYGCCDRILNFDFLLWFAPLFLNPY
jgi:hypothetical protein